VLETDQVVLLESPCSLIVGTVDASGLPDATRGWGLEVLPGGERVRLLLSSNASTSHDNLRDTGAIALTATHFSTLVSVQLKGKAIGVEPATAEDRIRFDRFCAGCVHDLHELDGTPEESIWRIAPPGIVACVFTIEEVFDQTPGPAAGARLAPAEV
jgi:hypothetical protein